MTEKKNIDRLFQEKFRDFEAHPGEHVWMNIEEALKKKKKRRVIPIWFRLSGVAAALVIALLVGGKLFFSDDRPNLNLAPNPETGVTLSNEPAVLNERSQQIRNPENTGSQTQANENAEDQNASVQAAPTRGEMVVKNQRRQAVTANESEPGNDSSPNNITRPQPRSWNQKATLAEKTNENNTPDKNGATDITSGNETRSVAGNQENTSRNISDTNRDDELKTSENEAIAAVEDTKKDSASVASAEPNALEELLNEKEKEVTITEQKLNRWQLTSNVAPIYFSSASNGSPLDERFESSAKNYKTSVSYGLGAQYSVNKRFAIRSGINALALEYSTDVVFFQTPNARKIANVNNTVPASLIQVDSNPGELANVAGRIDKRFDGLLNQSIGYIEVPVELSYKIIDRKFGVDLIGGFSTLFLNRNEVSLEGSGIDMTIGEANNLSPMHFSTNVGLGLKYNFMKSLLLKVEPVFKYQINTFSNDAGNFKPYFFGIYTGLNYRF